MPNMLYFFRLNQINSGMDMQTKFNEYLLTLFDNKSNAKNFKNELIKKVNDLLNMPFKFWQSIYFEDENIRDLIFKGYTIVYKIDERQEIITIIGMKKYQDSL